MEQDINIIGALLAAVSSFVLGGLWYSPALFGTRWMALAGLTRQQIENTNKLKVFGVSGAWSLVSAMTFAAFLGETPLPVAAAAGFTAGLFWVAGSLAINYQFEQRPFALWLINGGYHVLQFTLYGTIIGLANGW
jgi:hypothetical protein